MPASDVYGNQVGLVAGGNEHVTRGFSADPYPSAGGGTGVRVSQGGTRLSSVIPGGPSQENPKGFREPLIGEASTVGRVTHPELHRD